MVGEVAMIICITQLTMSKFTVKNQPNLDKHGDEKGKEDGEEEFDTILPWNPAISTAERYYQIFYFTGAWALGWWEFGMSWFGLHMAWHTQPDIRSCFQSDRREFQ